MKFITCCYPLGDRSIYHFWYSAALLCERLWTGGVKIYRACFIFIWHWLISLRRHHQPSSPFEGSPMRLRSFTVTSEIWLFSSKTPITSSSRGPAWSFQLTVSPRTTDRSDLYQPMVSTPGAIRIRGGNSQKTSLDIHVKAGDWRAIQSATNKVDDCWSFN